MSESDAKKRYDDFQRNAVKAVVGDFKNNPLGKYLLVIPTGGGKTFTAVKSVCELFRQGLLDLEKDQVLWVAHRLELIEQATKTFDAVINDWGMDIKVGKHILVEMVLASKNTLATNKNVKIVVIDEAHHATANSYGPIFEGKGHGILGLTATPSRHDGLPLEFDRESFSIGFPDLVKRGIILRPTVHVVAGGSYDIDDFSDQALAQLNNTERNVKIAKVLLEKEKEFKKVIVYVGTKQHSVDLCAYLNSTKLSDSYQSISYITGESNSRGQDRADFIAQEKTFERSILINVQVLTEGYDDPTVNTVVMAAPSKSKLYYMQAMGRAIRQDPKNAEKHAHVVEVIDELPNIRYRIDNRWLYSDISDALEPAVVDYDYASEMELVETLDTIYSEYCVKDCDKVYPEFDPNARYSLLLFRRFESFESYSHYVLLLDNDNRQALAGAYNFLSERMQTFVPKSYSADGVFQMVEQKSGTAFSKPDQRFIYDAMSNAYHALQPDYNDISYVESGVPWVTFVALNFRSHEDELDEVLLEFIADMTNREEVFQRLLEHDYSPGDVLIRLPHPLSGFVGMFITQESTEVLSGIVSGLSSIKRDPHCGQLNQVQQILHDAILPIETKYASALVTIARDSIEYKYQLT